MRAWPWRPAFGPVTWLTVHRGACTRHPWSGLVRPRRALVADLGGGAQLAEHGDGGEIGELARARVLRRHVLDLHGEPTELALDGDAMLVPRLARPGVDPDAGLLGPHAAQRTAATPVKVG